MEQPTVTVRQAAHILGISRSAAYRAAQSGFLPLIRLGPRRYMVSTAALARLLHIEERPTT